MTTQTALIQNVQDYSAALSFLAQVIPIYAAANIDQPKGFDFYFEIFAKTILPLVSKYNTSQSEEGKKAFQTLFKEKLSNELEVRQVSQITLIANILFTGMMTGGIYITTPPLVYYASETNNMWQIGICGYLIETDPASLEVKSMLKLNPIE